jgi:hypothetical protein
MLSDCLLIIVIALFTALLGEGLTWVLVYRSDEYKRLFIYLYAASSISTVEMSALLSFRLKSTMERKTKKLEKKKDSADSIAGGSTLSSTNKTQKRKIEKEQERLKV